MIAVPKLRLISRTIKDRIYQRFQLYKVRFNKNSKPPIFFCEKDIYNIGVWLKKGDKYFLIEEARVGLENTLKKLPNCVKEQHRKLELTYAKKGRGICGSFQYVIENDGIFEVVIIDWNNTEKDKWKINKKISRLTEEYPFKKYPFFTETLIHELTHSLYYEHGKPFQSLFYRFFNATVGNPVRKTYNFSFVIAVEKEVARMLTDNLKDLWEVSSYVSRINLNTEDKENLFSVTILGHIKYLKETLKRTIPYITFSTPWSEYFSYLTIPRKKNGICAVPITPENFLAEFC